MGRLECHKEREAKTGVADAGLTSVIGVRAIRKTVLKADSSWEVLGSWQESLRRLPLRGVHGDSHTWFPSPHPGQA